MKDKDIIEVQKETLSKYMDSVNKEKKTVIINTPWNKSDNLKPSLKQQFKQEYLGKFVQDEEYEHYLELWNKYRELTDNIPQYRSSEAYKIHKELFYGIPKNDKYQKAKINSCNNRI